MSSLLSDDRTRSVARTLQRSLEASLKAAVKEALEEVETERRRRSRVRRLVGALTFLGAGTAVGYLLRERRIPAEAAQTVAERAPEAVEPASQEPSGTRGRSTARRLVATGVGLGVAYGLRRWYGSRRRPPSIERAAEDVADRTERATGEAADRIEAGGQATGDRMERAGESAEDVREQTKDAIDERSEDDGQ